MARLVMKFGGTSVADIDRIRNVARHVKREVDAGHEVAVIVSAMAGATNKLVEFCRQASVLHDAREYDTVVASGEQVTSGLLAIALQEIVEFSLQVPGNAVLCCTLMAIAAGKLPHRTVTAKNVSMTFSRAEARKLRT